MYRKYSPFFEKLETLRELFNKKHLFSFEIKRCFENCETVEKSISLLHRIWEKRTVESQLYRAKFIQIQWHNLSLYSQIPHFQGYCTVKFLSILYILTILKFLSIIFVYGTSNYPNLSMISASLNSLDLSLGGGNISKPNFEQKCVSHSM